MNLKQLEAFVEVAEKNSFSKAAKSLYLTQPTVSAHIAALEKELGSRLLIRNTKEVELSESGKRLYEYAKQIVLLTAQIEQEFGKKEKRGEKPYFYDRGVDGSGAVSSSEYPDAFPKPVSDGAVPHS